MKGCAYPQLRLVVDNSDLKRFAGYKSGRKTCSGTPLMEETLSTRSAGMPLRRHLHTACVVTPMDRASAASPPEALIARTAAGFSIARSKPQVYGGVNLGLVAKINQGFHALGMKTTSPLGKTIKARLKVLKQNQVWLAEQVEVSKNAVSKWVATGEISRKNLELVAKALKITADELLGRPESAEHLDDRWRALPPSVKEMLLGLVEGLKQPEAPQKAGAPSRRRKTG